ncbi:MAG TPA: hypothetical protein VHY76_13215 [Acetobacteraceae bacterium]|nr:hypothetical protein [Acetobacteraceae bacterium]
MPFKPNYNMQRADRNRQKQAKKEAKAREQEEARARRKAAEQAGTPEPTEDSTEPEQPA